MALWLSGEKDADRLLEERPLALLIGMVLDQQVPFERAFAAPMELQRRLGKPLSAKAIASTDPEVLRELFSRTKALHRFPGAMADRVQQLCTIVVDEWGGKAETIWTTAKDGDELLQRLRALPGFGDQKARIFLALLGKQLGCRPRGWRAAASPYGDAGTTMSVADISSAASMEKVRSFKRAAKAAHRAASS
jgi:uncharacterized HhH-GPD family protein